MSKKSVIAIVTISLFVLSILSATRVEVVDANPLPWIFDPTMTVTIKSPANGTVNFLPVSVSFTSKADNQFSVSEDYTGEWVRSFFYVLDGQDMTTMGMRFEGTKTTTIYEKGIENGYRFDGQAILANLADGPHNITVYYGAVNRIGYVGTPEERIIINPTWQATSQFYVMNSLPYIIGIVAVVIVVIVGLLVYFKKYHKRSSLTS
jgi:hypothetical protein